MGEHISLVAAGYEMQCSCGHQWPGMIQVTSLDRNEHGEWVVTCPECNTTHIFDGNEVNHAY